MNSAHAEEIAASRRPKSPANPFVPGRDMLWAEKKKEDTIEVGDFYLGKLVGLVLTLLDATVVESQRTAAKSLARQLIRTWYNDCSEGARIVDLGGRDEHADKIREETGL